jgi:formamidopyrimidine-DNA glycosylase
MLELPEIEVLRRDLEKEVAGRRIKEAEVRSSRNAMKLIPRHGRRKEFRDLLVGARIDSVERVGRKLILDLDSDNALMIDVGTSARLSKTSASEEFASHTHVVIDFTIGGQLRIVDSELTGEVAVLPKDDVKAEVHEDSALDPLYNRQPLTWLEFSSLLEKKDAALKDALMDEGFVCGVGPVYSDEVLFSAGLRYDRPAGDLSSQDVRRLYRGLIETLHEAVRARGTSQGKEGFTDLGGSPGEFQVELKVFERAGEPCRRCRSEILKESFGDAHTYFCPQCQS